MGKEKTSQNDIVNYKKPNELINAISNGTLLAQKIFAISLQNLTWSGDKLIASIQGVELQRILHVKAGSLYPELKKLCAPVQKGEPYHASLFEWYLSMQNDEKRSFSTYIVVTEAHFSDGVLTLGFNQSIADKISAIRKNYTLLPYREMMAMKSVYSFRILEILLSAYNRAIALHQIKDGDKYTEMYNITDLKLKIGIIPCTNDEIQKELQSEYTSYERIEEIANDAGLNKYQAGNFMNRVISKAVDEINEKSSSIHVEFVPVKKEHAVKFVRFTMWNPNTKADELKEIKKPVLTPASTSTLIQVYPALSSTFTPDEVLQLITWSCNNADIVMQAYKVLQSSTTPVKNAMGFMKKAIEDNYKEKPHTNVKAPVKNKFTDFPQRHYTEEQLKAIEAKMTVKY